MAIWDLFSFFTIPITCALVYKLSFTNNLKANLMGEVLIINVSYLLEDGVELMMQYYYFDKGRRTKMRHMPSRFQPGESVPFSPWLPSRFHRPCFHHVLITSFFQNDYVRFSTWLPSLFSTHFWGRVTFNKDLLLVCV